MKRILLATDGSDSAVHAARFLSRWPHDEKLHLNVVSVLNPPVVSAASMQAEWIDKYLEEDRQRVEKSLATIRLLFDGANVDIEETITKGHAGETICRLARADQFDLIVLGAKGHSAVSRMLLGSTSDYVATHAPCSVLIVRPRAGEQSDRQSDQPSHDRLLIELGYEATEPAQAALQEISKVHWGGNVELHVVTIAFLYGLIDILMTEELRQGIDLAIEQLREVTPHVRGVLVENDHVGEGLVKYAEEHQCDVLVVGETNRTRLGRFLMGSTSRYVSRHAPCSVWITRNRIAKETPQEPAAS